MQNFEEIKQIFLNYDGGTYNVFIITKPKVRVVMSQNIKDKIINHTVARLILKQKLEKYLDNRNIATREKMGTDYGIKLLKKYLEKNKKYKEFYILKIDIFKYFYNIDHEILKKMLKDKLNEEEYHLLESIIDSTNKEYVNPKIDYFRKKYNLDLPYYQYGKGLPIGNMTSQFLSVFYLYELDHKIVHDFKIKYYIRYMDDFILIHHDKEKLKQVLKEIEQILEKQYLLKLNKKKTEIKKNNEWVEFLGYRFKVENKKTIFILRNSSTKRIRNRVKQIKYLYKTNQISEDTIFSSFMTYLNSFQYGSYLKRERIVKSFYEK